MRYILVLLIVCSLLAGCVQETAEEPVVQQAQDTEKVAGQTNAHLFSAEVTGQEMKSMTISEIADLWEIDAQILLDDIINEYELKQEYTIDTILGDITAETSYKPRRIKELAEALK